MGNGLLLSLFSWLLLSGQGAPPSAASAFLVALGAAYCASFLTLARHPEQAVVGYKG